MPQAFRCRWILRPSSGHFSPTSAHPVELKFFRHPWISPRIETTFRSDAVIWPVSTSSPLTPPSSETPLDEATNLKYAACNSVLLLLQEMIHDRPNGRPAQACKSELVRKIFAFDVTVSRRRGSCCLSKPANHNTLSRELQRSTHAVYCWIRSLRVPIQPCLMILPFVLSAIIADNQV